MKAKQSKLDLFAEQLDGWFGDEKITLDEAKERLAGLGCKVGRDRLSVWWQQRQSARLQERLLGQIASGARHVKEVESAFGKTPAPALETIMNLHRVLALQLATASATNPDMIELAERCTRMVLYFAKLEQKRKEVSLDERRLELLEKKAEQADAAKEVVESKLSAEEKALRMRQIFGMG